DRASDPAACYNSRQSAENKELLCGRLRTTGCTEAGIQECWLEESPLTASLVRRCIAGDTAAWEELVRENSRRIYNICYRFTGSGSGGEDLKKRVINQNFRSLKSLELQ